MKAFLLAALTALTSTIASAHPRHDHPGMTHLTFANGAIHAHATWTQGPQSPNESVLRLEWKRGSDHSPTEPPGQFKVVLWMPDMGHGSAPTQIQRVLNDQGQPLIGVYQVSNVYFTMGGKWDVNVTLKYANGTEETKSIKVEVDGDGGHHH